MTPNEKTLQCAREAIEALAELAEFRTKQMSCPRKDIAMVVAYRARAIATLRALYANMSPQDVAHWLCGNAKHNILQVCLLVEGAIESGEDDARFAGDIDWHSRRRPEIIRTQEAWQS